MTANDRNSIILALIDTCRLFGGRGWCLATSGNFSARLGADSCLITRSGTDKSQLAQTDLLECDLSGTPRDAGCRPSAETPLHTCLYRLDASIGAVLHTHSPAATVLSMRAGSMLSVRGFEMQKAFAGIASHADGLSIRVYDNDQDMQALAGRLEADWLAGRIAVPGFLIAGHGLYAWGASVAEARRHVEGFEFLLDCTYRSELLAKS